MTLTPLPYQSAGPNQNDVEHIKLLVIFTYIWSGIVGLTGCLGLIYVFLGFMFVISGPGAMGSRSGANAPPAFLGWLFIGIGGGIFSIAMTLAGLTAYSARCMQLRKNRTLSLVMAGISCLSIPLGTALGVFTLIVLLRESVAQLYRFNAESKSR